MKKVITYDTYGTYDLLHQGHINLLRRAKELNTEKYYLQEAFINWPLGFTKIKLRGTSFQESGMYVNVDNECGIFLDVFKLENAPSSKMTQRWQYLCTKYLLCYCLLERGWSEVSGIKKLMMCKAGKSNTEIRTYIQEYEKKYPKWWECEILKYIGKPKQVFLKFAQWHIAGGVKLIAFIHSLLIKKGA